MTHTAKTAPEADEKMIERLRDAMTFDQRGLELLGPETTRRLAFAVCNKLGLIPRSTEQAEIFLNAMRAAGQLSVADVNSAKWDILGEEHSAGHTFAPVDEPCPVALAKELEKRLSGRKPTLRQQIKAAVEGGPRGRAAEDEPILSGLLKYTLEVGSDEYDLYLRLYASNGFRFTRSLKIDPKHRTSMEKQFYNTIATGEQVLELPPDEPEKRDRKPSELGIAELIEAAEQRRAEIEKLRLENTRLKAFEEAFLSILSSLNHLGDYLHGRGELDED